MILVVLVIVAAAVAAALTWYDVHLSQAALDADPAESGAENAQPPCRPLISVDVTITRRTR